MPEIPKVPTVKPVLPINQEKCPKCGSTEVKLTSISETYTKMECRNCGYRVGDDWRQPSPLKEGWVWFLNSKKAHYVKEHRALCGRWLYLGNTYELGNDDSVDNCAECRRRLLKTNWREAKKLAKEGLIQ